MRIVRVGVVWNKRSGMDEARRTYWRAARAVMKKAEVDKNCTDQIHDWCAS